MRECIKCLCTKPLKEFTYTYRGKRVILLHCKWCVKCFPAVRDLIASYVEYSLDYNQVYRRIRKGQYAFHTANRHAAILQRTPKWLTEQQKQEISAFYIKSAALTKELGIRFEVDHIIPLQGRIISGLHMPENLQILTKIENNKKLNKF